MSARSRKASKASYNKRKGSSARTFVRDRTPFFLFRGSPLPAFRDAALELQQHQHHADAQQDVPDAGNAGDRSIGPLGKLGAQHLCHAAHHHHHGGDVQTDLIGQDRFAGLGGGKGKALFQQEKQQEEQHSQQKVVGVHHCKGGLAGKAVELGELAVEHPAHHGEDGVHQRGIEIAFHRHCSFFIFNHCFVVLSSGHRPAEACTEQNACQLQRRPQTGVRIPFSLFCRLNGV